MQTSAAPPRPSRQLREMASAAAGAADEATATEDEASRAPPAQVACSSLPPSLSLSRDDRNGCGNH
eukprot:6743321-Pyramimonas_sp.AAC.1